MGAMLKFWFSFLGRLFVLLPRDGDHLPSGSIVLPVGVISMNVL